MMSTQGQKQALERPATGALGQRIGDANASLSANAASIMDNPYDYSLYTLQPNSNVTASNKLTPYPYEKASELKSEESPSEGLADMVTYVIETQELYDEGLCQVDAGIVNVHMDMDVLAGEINAILRDRSVPVRVEVGGLLHRVRKDDDGVYTRHSVLRFRIRDVTLMEMAKGE